MAKGKVGDGLEVGNAGWRFRGPVVEEFDAHVGKSVPFYGAGQDMVEGISDFFVSDDSVIYDFGTATGEIALRLANRHKQRPNLRIIGVDVEADMIARAEAKKTEQGLTSVTFLADDVVQMPLEPCDLVVAYYTIQFIRPRVRQDLFNKIYSALNWGGAFLLFEKVRGPDARFQDILTALYTDYKLQQGYNAEEIVGKTRSLKGVLEPFSTQGNFDLLHRAGFVDYMTVFKHICFEGILAIK